ncbi:glycosyltransferase family 4 protein [Rosistilla oblonga]|uniref:glycosyltransferase family 4 protein n=1 Tax=Rosistilla oblonga TaxID=2527990 RepID=UPI003A9719AC
MAKPTRVLILTQYFPPETGAPQARLFEMAKRLVARGYDVEVLTAMPNYPQGKIYNGYRGKWHVVEEIEGMRVIHSPIFPSRSARLVPRLASYFSFVVSSILWGLCLVRRPDVLICESPPLFLGLSAIFLKTVFRCPLIFNVSDLWPESAVRMGLHNKKFLVTLAVWLERFCYRSAAAVTCQSHGIVRGVRSKSQGKRVELLPNGCDCERFKPAHRSATLREKYGVEDKLVVGYAGLLGVAQGIGAIVEVAERLRFDSRIQFLIVGDGPEREYIEKELQLRRLPNVKFTGWLGRDEMPAMVASFDIGFVPLKYYIPGALPSKIYETMASETPVLLASQGGDPEELLCRANAGVSVDYDAPDEVAGAIARLADSAEERMRLGRNGRRYVLTHHQREIISERLAVLIDDVTGSVASKTQQAA